MRTAHTGMSKGTNCIKDIPKILNGIMVLVLYEFVAVDFTPMRQDSLYQISNQ